MNGAENLIQALQRSGVDTCFANPGTSEMQLVAAIGETHEMRAILCLFEGVVTGAADGYGRMKDKPALTLLHLGPGLGNGTANLHNARRAGSPVLNMIGDHASYHLEYDAPLTADIDGFAKPVSDWVGRSKSADTLAKTGLDALSFSLQYPGRVASFIAPADHSWEVAIETDSIAIQQNAPVTEQALINRAAEILRRNQAVGLYLGGRALREEELYQAGRIATASNARLISETFSARLQRGAGRVPVERLPYFGEQAAEFLSEFNAIICIGARPPVSFFAYPGKPSWLIPPTTETLQLADQNLDAHDALTRLADALSGPAAPETVQPSTLLPIQGKQLNALSLGRVLAANMPNDCIISDEAATCSALIYAATQGAPRHDWLMLTGGAIGQGLPVAIGAAVACPDRQVVALQADGSAMYTLQSLWTMAREKLDVVTIILNNGSYAILNIELQRVGVEHPSAKTRSLLDLTNPAIDWVSIAEGMGVTATRAESVASFERALKQALSTPGPSLIEAMI